MTYLRSLSFLWRRMALATILLVPVTTYAATTGQVLITASVPAACAIVVTPAAGASIANLTLGATNLKVATVTETCNSPDGYYVEISGAHSGNYTGRFVDSVSGRTQNFAVNYNGSSVNATKITDVSAPASNVSKDVNITYPADNTLTATVGATYTETLNFTITAK